MPALFKGWSRNFVRCLPRSRFNGFVAGAGVPSRGSNKDVSQRGVRICGCAGIWRSLNRSCSHLAHGHFTGRQDTMAHDHDNEDGVSRRHALESMAWAGAGVLLPSSLSIPKSLGLLGRAEAAQAKPTIPIIVQDTAT